MAGMLQDLAMVPSTPAKSSVAANGIGVELRDGRAALLRPITPDDKGRLRAGFERLSPESRYRRFLTPMKRLSEEQLAYLTEVDHHDHEALIAVEPQTAEGLGVARFVRLAEAPDAAEAAVAIVDDWQGRGLGTALLGALADRARAEGIQRFRCLVLAENQEMIDLLRDLGPVQETSRQPGTVEVDVDLQLPREGIGADLAALLRTAASEAIKPLFHRRSFDDGDLDQDQRAR